MYRLFRINQQNHEQWLIKQHLFSPLLLSISHLCYTLSNRLRVCFFYKIIFSSSFQNPNYIFHCIYCDSKNIFQYHFYFLEPFFSFLIILTKREMLHGISLRLNLWYCDLYKPVIFKLSVTVFQVSDDKTMVLCKLSDFLNKLSRRLQFIRLCNIFCILTIC